MAHDILDASERLSLIDPMLDLDMIGLGLLGEQDEAAGATAARVHSPARRSHPAGAPPCSSGRRA